MSTELFNRLEQKVTSAVEALLGKFDEAEVETSR